MPIAPSEVVASVSFDARDMIAVSTTGGSMERKAGFSRWRDFWELGPPLHLGGVLSCTSDTLCTLLASEHRPRFHTPIMVSPLIRASAESI